MKRSHETFVVSQKGQKKDEPHDSPEEKQEQELQWKDDDFLAFNGGRTTTDATNKKTIDQDETAGYDSMEEDAMEESSSSSSSAEGDAEMATPPWILLQHHHHHRSYQLSSSSPLVALHNEILQFVQLMEPLETERVVRTRLVQELQAAVRQEFGASAQLLVLGSQATGLFLPTSDIDLTLQYNDADDENGNNDDKNIAVGGSTSGQHANDTEKTYNPLYKKPIQRFSDLMAKKEWKDRLSYLETIVATRVPIVKMRFSDSDIAVDVSFNQPNGVTAAALMTEYLNAMPPLRPLTIILKYFLAARDLNEPYSGGVGSYLLQLLIVSFLQHRERMAYHDNVRLDYNLGSLLLDFLELYGLDFNYLVTGLSVRFDGFYYRKSNASRPNCISVENPLEVAHDVGSSSYRYTMVQRSFAIAYKTLLAMITPGPRPSSNTTPKNSILGSILPISPYMTSRLVVKRRDRALSAPRHNGAAAARGRPPPPPPPPLRSGPNGALSAPRNGALSAARNDSGALSAPRNGRNQESNNNNNYKKRKIQQQNDYAL